MQYNSEANGDDLVSDVKFWCGIASTDSTRYPINDITRNANRALDRIVSLIIRADGTWEFDDSNQTDLPVATTALVANQRDYSVATSHLRVHKVLAKDASGTYHELEPVDLKGNTNTGTGDPRYYDKVGNSIFLEPIPSYGASEGLKLYFQRGASYFAPSDTTKIPGFASTFHRLISLHAALDYVSVNDMPKRQKQIQERIAALEGELQLYYSQRNPDEKVGMTLDTEDYGGRLLNDNTVSESRFDVP